MMEEVQISIDTAVSTDAFAMEWLKYDNHLYRVSTGELKLSREKIEQMKPTEESVRSFAETLACSNDNDYYLVAKSQKGEVLCFCRMTWQPRSHQFQLSQFYALPEFIGKKIGSKLMAAAKKRAICSKHKPKGIFGLTRSFNVKMQARNEHWGFRYARPDECDFEQNAAGTIVKMVLDFEQDLIHLGS